MITNKNQLIVFFILSLIAFSFVGLCIIKPSIAITVSWMVALIFGVNSLYDCVSYLIKNKGLK